ncbi:hypothetical protein [Thiomicrorhabdus sp.]|uniref:hypothetical protein n=1 Tax=Thiomicrorhabdus sp. TaxID=2039724 RepID=UPI0035675D4A
MNKKLIEALQFRGKTTLINASSNFFKPTTMPPSEDFVISVNSEGKTVSKYGDDSWDLRPFNGSVMYFDKHDDQNNAEFKEIMFLWIYHYVLFPRTHKSVTPIYIIFQKIAAICYENGVSMTNLSRFPRLIEKIAQTMPPSYFNPSVTYLNKLLSIKDEWGKCVLDEKGIATFCTFNPHYLQGQNAAIPPRIWNYTINCIDKILGDFIEHQDRITNAFNWLAKAYSHNLKLEINDRYRTPFSYKSIHKNIRVLYEGNFETFAKNFGIYPLMDKYLAKDKKTGNFEITQFSKLFTIGRSASMVFILNYTLMRRNECGSIRCDAFQFDEDEVYGRLAMIIGETTKTEDNNEARWPTSESVEKAFTVAKSLSNLRMLFAPESLPTEIKSNPFLFTPSYEPWAPKHTNLTKIKNVRSFSETFLHEIFDANEIKISEEDYRIALALTPSLTRKKWFKIGSPWQFNYHQFRRTVAVRLAEANVSESTIQYQLKHRDRAMQYHYTKNHTRLHFSSEAAGVVLSEKYNALYRQLETIVTDEIQTSFIKPHSRLNIDVQIVNLLEQRDKNKIIKLIKNEKINCRPTLLGFCLKNGSCEYGGIESVSKCAGGDGANICAEAIFSKSNEQHLIRLKQQHEESLKLIDEASPKYCALKKEIYAIEVYQSVINRN